MDLTWNINGLNHKKKQNKIEYILQKQNLDIICLQKTHAARRHKRVLINKRLGLDFVSSDESKERGMIMYLKEKLETKKNIRTKREEW